MILFLQNWSVEVENFFNFENLINSMKIEETLEGENMTNLKDYLQEKKLFLEKIEEMKKPANIVQSRNHFLAAARGYIRLHLQQQLLEAIQKFQDETRPENPGKIA